LRAVAVPALLILRAFVTCVFVAVIVKLPVTVKFVAVTLPRVVRPVVCVKFPYIEVSPLTIKFWVDIVDNTFRSPATLEYPI
jgi:hypothetical protein